VVREHLYHLGENFDGTETVIDHPPTMIGDEDPGYTAFSRSESVIGSHHTLDEDRQVDLMTQPLEA
jgi:hypothetical protein